METLLDLIQQLSLELDEINDHKKLNFKKYIDLLQKYDTNLTKQLMSTSLSANEKVRLLEKNTQVFNSFSRYLNLQFRNKGLISDLSREFEVFHSLVAKSSFNYKEVNAYLYRTKFSKRKLIPLITIIDDLNEIYEKKYSIISYLQILYNEMKKPDFVHLINHKNRDSILTLIGFLNDEIDGQYNFYTIKKELFTHQHLTEQRAKQYSKAFQSFKKQIKKITDSAELNGNKLHELVGLKEKDFDLFHQLRPYYQSKNTRFNPEKIEKLLGNIAQSTDVKDSAFYRLTSGLPLEGKYHKDSFQHSIRAPFKPQNPYTRQGILNFQKSDLALKTRSWNYKAIKTLGKRTSALKTVLGKLFLGTAATTVDFALIGAEGLSLLVIGSMWISRKLGWADPLPQQYSVQYYSNQIKTLDKEIHLSNLVEQSNQNMLVVSQRDKSIISRKALLEAAREIAILNKSTTELYAQSTDTFFLSMQSFCSSKTQAKYLANELKLVRQYEFFKHNHIPMSIETEDYYNNRLVTSKIIENELLEHKQIMVNSLKNMDDFNKAIAVLERRELENDLAEIKQFLFAQIDKKRKPHLLNDKRDQNAMLSDR